MPWQHAQCWQTMDNAPKDGEPLDLWVVTKSKKTGEIKHTRRVVDAFYQTMPYHGWRWAKYYSGVRGPEDAIDVTTEYTDDRVEEITHWLRTTPPNVEA